MKKILIFIFFLLLTNNVLSKEKKLEDYFNKLHSSNLQERVRAARELGSLKDKKAIPEMINVLKKEKNEEVKIALIDSLGVLKSKEAVPVLLKMLKNEKNDKVRVRIIVALRKIGDKNSISVLKELLKDKNPLVQIYSAGACGKMGFKKALSVLVNILKKQERFKVYAIENMGFFKQKKAAEVLIPFLKEEEKQIRRLAIRALGDIGEEIAVSPIEEILKKEKDKIILKECISALGKIGSPSSAETLYPFLKPSDKKEKILPLAALKSLSSLKNKAGIPYLIKCFQDEEIPRWVRGRAIDIVRNEGSKSQKEEAIKLLLKDKRWTVWWKTSEAEFLKKYISDKNEIVRARAYSALARIDEKKIQKNSS